MAQGSREPGGSNKTTPLWTEGDVFPIFGPPQLVETVLHFGYYLYGKEFVAYTDGKSLCALLLSDRLNRHLRRLGIKLQHWLITIQYLLGEDNGMADALSREERHCETVVDDGHQSGCRVCEGETSTVSTE